MMTPYLLAQDSSLEQGWGALVGDSITRHIDVWQAWRLHEDRPAWLQDTVLNMESLGWRSQKCKLFHVQAQLERWSFKKALKLVLSLWLPSFFSVWDARSMDPRSTNSFIHRFSPSLPKVFSEWWVFLVFVVHVTAEVLEQNLHFWPGQHCWNAESSQNFPS